MTERSDLVAGVGMFLPAQPIAFVLCAALLGWTAARVAASHELARERVLALGVWFCTLLVLYSQVLSAFTQLHWPGLLMLTTVGAAIVLVRVGRQPGRWRAPLASALRGVAAEGGWPLAMLLVPLVAYGLWEAWLVLFASETCGDNVSYHLPRLGYWLARQSVAPFLSNDPRIGTFPPNGNILQLFPVLFMRSEQLSPFAQLLAMFGTGVAIYGIARDLGRSPLACAAAAFCWFCIPSALALAIVSYVDLIATFFTVAAVAFAVAAVSRPGRSAWSCLAAAALAIGTKPQVALVVVPAVTVALAAAWRSGRRATWQGLAGGLALVYFVAAAGPLQNQFTFGSPYGFSSVAWLLSDPRLKSLVVNVQLLLSPLDPRLDPISPYGGTDKWSVVGASTGLGLGLVWLVAMLGALAHFAWRAIRRRPAPIRLEALYLAAAACFLVSTLFLMRHQHSVLRFALPAVAMMTPLIASALERSLARHGWWRIAATALLSMSGAWVLSTWAMAELKGRVREGRGVEFKSRAEVCDAPYVPLAHAFEELGRRYGTPRVGLISRQSSYQRFFFGVHFTNIVVPLSYASDQDLDSLDRLALDAIWLESSFAGMELFRQRFSPPAPGPAKSWRYVSRAFDEDFTRAMEQVVQYRSFESLASRLARKGSGWGVLFADAHGILFTRQATTEDALVLLDVSSPNGIKWVDGVAYDRLGDEPVSVTAFAGRSGTVALEASFVPGASRRGWPSRRVVVRDPWSRGELTSVAGQGLAVPVKAGLNRFLLQPRSTSDGAPGDRPGQLAMGALRLSWVQ